MKIRVTVMIPEDFSVCECEWLKRGHRAAAPPAVDTTDHAGENRFFMKAE